MFSSCGCFVRGKAEKQIECTRAALCPTQAFEQRGSMNANLPHTACQCRSIDSLLKAIQSSSSGLYVPKGSVQGVWGSTM